MAGFLNEETQKLTSQEAKAFKKLHDLCASMRKMWKKHIVNRSIDFRQCIDPQALRYCEINIQEGECKFEVDGSLANDQARTFVLSMIYQSRGSMNVDFTLISGGKDTIESKKTFSNWEQCLVEIDNCIQIVTKRLQLPVLSY